MQEKTAHKTMIKINSGITIVEILIVVIVISLLAVALMPQIRSTYYSWRYIDRQLELLQNAHSGADKIIRDLRQAYKLEHTASPSEYIEFRDGTFSAGPSDGNAATRAFYFDLVSNELNYGTNQPLSVTPYAYYVDDFYLTGYQRATPYYPVTYARRVIALENLLSLADSEGIVEENIQLNTWVYPRVSREGYSLSNSSRTGAVTSCEWADWGYDDYSGYSRGAQHDVCVKLYSDRVNFETMSLGVGSSTINACLCRRALVIACKNSFQANDSCADANFFIEGTISYYATPTWYLNIDNVNNVIGIGNRWVFMRIRDADGETFYIEDLIQIIN